MSRDCSLLCETSTIQMRSDSPSRAYTLPASFWPEGCMRRPWQSSAGLAGRPFARRRSPEAPLAGFRAGILGRRRYVRHLPPKPAPSMHAPPPAPVHHSIRHRSSGPFGRRPQVRRYARPVRRAIQPPSGVRQVRRRSTRPMPRDHRKGFRSEGRYTGGHTKTETCSNEQISARKRSSV